MSTLLERPDAAKTPTTNPALPGDRQPETPGAVRHSRIRHVRRLSRSAWIDVAAVTLIAVGAITMVATNVDGAPAYQDDEGTYTAQAMSVQQGSLAPYTYWYDHPPFGWIQLSIIGAFTRLLGLGDGTDVGATRYAMALFFAASAVLIYLIARRLNALPVFALAAAAVFILSPLSLSNGRQVYLDSIATPWLLLGFFLAVSPRVALWNHAGAGGAFAIAVLSKLTAAVFGPALLIAIIDRPRWRGRSFSIVGFLAVGGLLLALFPLMALLRGELLSGAGHVSLEDGLLYQFASRSGSGYLWEAGSGRNNLVGSWFDGDGFILACGLVAALICLSSRRTRWITLAVASFFVPVVSGQGYLPAMYIVGGIPFLCLAIGIAADLAWRGSLGVVRRKLTGAKYSAHVLIAIVLAAVLLPIPVQSWAEKDHVLLSADQNADWQKSLDWLTSHVPHDDTVLVPYSMWQDANAAGWNDPWKMVVLEKADLDSSFDTHHPRGWSDIQWIVDGPTVEPNIRYLGLAKASKAYDASTVVATFGAWKIREVHMPAATGN